MSHFQAVRAGVENRSVRIPLLALGLTLGLVACGSDSPTAVDQPLSITVSEVPTASGGSQARFSWGPGSVYRLSVSRRNANGTSTIMWSWEVIDPHFAVATGITYGATPAGASCSIHACTATGLTRGVPYNVKVWYGLEKSAELNFTL